MTSKTQAIVLAWTRYKDNVSIAHLYTAENGRMQYVVYGNKYRGILSPLSIVEITISHVTKNGLGVLTAATLVHVPQQLTTDVKRQCVAMFITEILYKTLKHPLEDRALFTWLCSVIKTLDGRENIENIHIQFLKDYANFLGIGIDETEHTEWTIPPANRQQRQQLLRDLCAYYEEHIEDFSSPKSIDVLIEVFD